MMKKFTKILVFSLTILFLISTFSYAGSIEAASDQQVSLIGVLLNNDVVIIKSAAIRSSNHKRAYYVGLNFRVSGVDKTLTGVWIVSGDKNQPNGVLAVDGFAKNFSRATAADKTNPPTAYVYDEECKRLQSHLKP
jgi:hypothetical protein